MTLGQEVSLSQANLAKDDDFHDEEVAKDTADGTVEKLPSDLRFFRKINYFEYNSKGWGKPINFVMYIMYVLVAVLTAVNGAVTEPIPGLHIFGIVCYSLWIALNVLNSLYAWGSIRQSIAWVGPYIMLLDYILNVGTMVMFQYSFQDIAVGSFGLEYGLLIVMAGAIYVDQRLVDPAFKNLYYYYHGAISKDEFKDGVPPIAGVSNSILLKIAASAGKALFLPTEAIATIQKEIGTLKIRQGEEDALDDWTYTINKLTRAVSFSPSFCKPKSKITAEDCQNLTVQMILYIRIYLATGKVFEDNAERTAPLSVKEALLIVAKLSFQVPVYFIIGFLPRSVFGVCVSALVPNYVGDFTNGVVVGDQRMATNAIIGIIVFTLLGPVFSAVAAYTEPLFGKKLISHCRRKMLRSTLKGGTEFDQRFPRGKIVDGFSAQLAQFELYMVSFFITMIPLFFQTFSAVYIASVNYAPAVYLFISLMPLVLSVSYFEERATRASTRKVRADAILSGKINSAVECRDAIRAANVSDWIEKDMNDSLEQTDNSHFATFFRSALSRNYIEIVSTVYSILIIVPLALSLIGRPERLGTFSVVQIAMASLLTPLSLVGEIAKNTTLTAGAIQTVSSLMDDSLNEESSSGSSGATMTLKKLSSSVSIKDIKFRYSPRLPDVIKGVNLGLSPASYSVLMGGSGSGKSTVLNLLMRFREPSEGTVEWDGTDIYSTSLDSFREQVGVMFQRTMIYQGTIRSNILFGQPEVPGAVEKAARDAEIAEVIERLPDGYDTVIGGDALAGMSGGQLQRVCMARALYKKPSVLLLDEATSALDAETESSIIKTLVKLRDEDGLTLVSVSHHPSTAVEADKIVVLDHGVIAEEGTYDELMSRGGIFKRMVEAK